MRVGEAVDADVHGEEAVCGRGGEAWLCWGWSCPELQGLSAVEASEAAGAGRQAGRLAQADTEPDGPGSQPYLLSLVHLHQTLKADVLGLFAQKYACHLPLLSCRWLLSPARRFRLPRCLLPLARQEAACQALPSAICRACLLLPETRAEMVCVHASMPRPAVCPCLSVHSKWQMRVGQVCWPWTGEGCDMRQCFAFLCGASRSTDAATSACSQVPSQPFHPLPPLHTYRHARTRADSQAGMFRGRSGEALALSVQPAAAAARWRHDVMARERKPLV